MCDMCLYFLFSLVYYCIAYIGCASQFLLPAVPNLKPHNIGISEGPGFPSISSSAHIHKTNLMKNIVHSTFPISQWQGPLLPTNTYYLLFEMDMRAVRKFSKSLSRFFLCMIEKKSKLSKVKLCKNYIFNVLS
jgi:hypothetical protein